MGGVQAGCTAATDRWDRAESMQCYLVSNAAVCAESKQLQTDATELRACDATFSSMLPSVQNLKTCTSFFCPIRWARSIACKHMTTELYNDSHKAGVGEAGTGLNNHKSDQTLPRDRMTHCRGH